MLLILKISRARIRWTSERARDEGEREICTHGWRTIAFYNGRRVGSAVWFRDGENTARGLFACSVYSRHAYIDIESPVVGTIKNVME